MPREKTNQKKQKQLGAKIFRNDMTVAYVGSMVGMVLFYIKFGGTSLLYYIPVAICILYMQYKIQIVTKIVHYITSGFSHTVAFLLQIVLIFGRKNTTPSGWIEATNWDSPSTSLWGKAAAHRNYYTNQKNSNSKAVTANIKNGKKIAIETLILILVVLTADIALGVVSNKILPQETISFEENLTSAQLEGENLEKLQEDARKFVFDFTNVYPVDKSNGDKLWQITEGQSETINYNQETGRKTYTPETTTYTIALIGGSSAFGTGQSDDRTIASFLSRKLEKEGKNTRIYNYGIPAYTTYQAAKSIEKKLEKGEKFDAILVLSGFNDVILGGDGSRIPETLLDESMNAYYNPNILLKWADNSLTARLVGYKKRQKKPIMTRVDPIGEVSKNAALGLPEKIEESMKYNIVKGVEELNYIQEKYNTPIVYAWVPRKLTAETDGAETSLGKMSLRLLVENQKKLTQETLEDSIFIDLDETRLAQSCFLDEVHTVGSCSEKQAEAIATKLLEKTLQ